MTPPSFHSCVADSVGKLASAQRLTYGLSDREGIISVEPRRGIDDWDKSASFDVGATPRRSTSSLGPT
jgi:hypothetical protein